MGRMSKNAITQVPQELLGISATKLPKIFATQDFVLAGPVMPLPLPTTVSAGILVVALGSDAQLTDLSGAIDPV